MAKGDTLSLKERAFVVAYTGEAAGNATKAAIIAGYSRKTARQIGARLLTRVHIRDAVAKIADRREQRAILTADQRRELLSTMAAAQDEHPIARLKAVDILNKMDGLYVQKVEHNGTVTLEELVAGAAAPQGASGG